MAFFHYRGFLSRSSRPIADKGEEVHWNPGKKRKSSHTRGAIDAATERGPDCQMICRKHSDESLFDSQESERDDKTSASYEIDSEIASSSGMTSASSTKVARSSSTESSPPPAKIWSSLFGSQRTLAPKRIVGQYFLDLGQSDFSYSTCRTCGMLYAPGHENDEKVHQSFHRNYLQGIQFKGWRDERVVSRIDLSGNRVIIIRAEEIHQRTKVREVIDFMEVELGLTPGWLLQKSCTMYVFVSAAKKIVGCLMAERIQSAYRVVPESVEISVKDGKVTPSEEDAPSQATQTVDLSEPAFSDACGVSDISIPEFAASAHSTDAREPCKKDEQAMRPCTSGREEKPAGTSDRKSIFVSVSAGRTRGRPSVKQKGSTPSLGTVKDAIASNDEPRKAKITDFFLLKDPRPGQRSCKPEQDRNETGSMSAEGRSIRHMDGANPPTTSVKQEPGDVELKELHTDEKPDPRSEQPHADKKPTLNFEQACKVEKTSLDSKQVLPDQKPKPNVTACPKSEESSHECNKKFDFKPGQVNGKINPTLDEVSPKTENDHSWTNTTGSFNGIKIDKEKQLESQSSNAFDKSFVHGGKDDGRGKVMLFGNVKFSRELVTPKRVKREQLQNLGRAILRTTEPVPAICGVRAIWVSQSERRKGIATHLLDAMRKSFVLGVLIGTQQFAFSQPTPEGRKFAEQYCRTNQFLVYTTR